MLRWFTQLRATEPDFPISGEMLHTKANTFMEMFGHEDKVSMAWINRWKVCHLIYSKKLVGEAVDPPDVKERCDVKIPLLLHEFPPENIFNADETGLFVSYSLIVLLVSRKNM